MGGGHLEPPARVSSGGCPGFIYPLGPGTCIRTDQLRSSRRPLLDGSALRCRAVVHALFVVTHPVPPVCDQCLWTGLGESINPLRAVDSNWATKFSCSGSSSFSTDASSPPALVLHKMQRSVTLSSAEAELISIRELLIDL